MNSGMYVYQEMERVRLGLVWRGLKKLWRCLRSTTLKEHVFHVHYAVIWHSIILMWFEYRANALDIEILRCWFYRLRQKEVSLPWIGLDAESERNENWVRALRMREKAAVKAQRTKPADSLSNPHVRIYQQLDTRTSFPIWFVCTGEIRIRIVR